MSQEVALSAKQAAVRAGVTPRTIYRWVQDGLLTPSFVTPSGRPRFRVADVLRRRRGASAPTPSAAPAG